MSVETKDIENVVIVGSGPRRLHRGHLRVARGSRSVVVAGLPWGGQLMLTTEVENYPGYPDGVRARR